MPYTQVSFQETSLEALMCCTSGSSLEEQHFSFPSFIILLVPWQVLGERLGYLHPSHGFAD